MACMYVDAIVLLVWIRPCDTSDNSDSNMLALINSFLSPLASFFDMDK